MEHEGGTEISYILFGFQDRGRCGRRVHEKAVSGRHHHRRSRQGSNLVHFLSSMHDHHVRVRARAHVHVHDRHVRRGLAKSPSSNSEAGSNDNRLGYYPDIDLGLELGLEVVGALI